MSIARDNVEKLRTGAGGGDVPEVPTGTGLTYGRKSDVGWVDITSPQPTTLVNGGTLVVNEEEAIDVVISDFNAEYTYIATVNGGTVGSLVGDTYVWTLPSVDVDTDYSISVTATAIGSVISLPDVTTVNVKNIPVIEDHSMIHNDTNIDDIYGDGLANMTSSGNVLVATAIDTTNIIDTAVDGSFTTLTRVVDGDVLSVDGSELIASGVIAAEKTAYNTNPYFSDGINGYTVAAAISATPSNGEVVLNTVNYADAARNFSQVIDTTEIIGIETAISIEITDVASFGGRSLYLRAEDGDTLGSFSLINIGRATVGVMSGTITPISGITTIWCVIDTTANGQACTIDNFVFGETGITYAVPTTGTPTTAYINEHRALSNEATGTNLTGVVSSTEGGRPFRSEQEFANISTATQVDVLITPTPIADGDNLVIVKADESIVEYDSISGVSDVFLPSSEKATPVMTGPNTPSGAATSSGEFNLNYPAWDAFDGVVATGGNNAWTSTDTVNPWIQYEFDSAVIIGSYLINSTFNVDYAFDTHSLLGSNTGSFTGEEVTLTTVTETQAENTPYSYTVANPQSFTHYRLVADVSKSICIVELELYLALAAYSYTLDPVIGEIPSKAYAVDSQHSFKFGRDYEESVIKTGGDSYSGVVLPAKILTDAHTAAGSPTGTVTASSSGGTGYSYNAFSQNDTLYWSSNAIACSITYLFSTAQKIEVVRVQEAEIRSPEDFTFEVSADGSSWTNIATLVGVPVSGFKTWVDYPITTPIEAHYFRMSITKGRDTVNIYVQEIALMQNEKPPVLTTTRLYDDLVSSSASDTMETKVKLKAVGDRLELLEAEVVRDA